VHCIMLVVILVANVMQNDLFGFLNILSLPREVLL